MESPPNYLQSVDTILNRRATRRALAELPPRLAVLHVAENRQTPPATVTSSNGRVSFLGIRERINLPDSYLTPSPSPDEIVIQQRGRRRCVTVWSPPGSDERKDFCGRYERTPVKNQSSPTKSSIVLRSTPRKRLILTDTKEITATPEKLKKLSPISKKCRVEKKASNCTGSLQNALKGLSNEQLVELIQTIMNKHCIKEEEVREIIPTPDLTPLEERLVYLKKNIYKSLPTSRLMSKTDSPAYNRAATHIIAFKKCVIDQGRHLVESEHWDAVLDYVFLAWSYVRGTPVWDHPPHNNSRRHCFKFLADQCLLALRKGTWAPEQCDEIEERLERCTADGEEIQSCIKQLSVIRRKGL